MAIKKTIILDVQTKDAVENLDKVDGEVKQINESTGELNNTVDKFTGGAVSKFKGFKNSLKGVITSFKSLKVAIIATGLGALLIAVVSIAQAFRNSEEGQNKFAKLMGVIGSVVGNVTDVLADLGNFLIDLFSGDGEAVKTLESFGKKIFDVVGLPIKTIITTVKTLGKTIGALFSGDVEGALDALNEGVGEVKNNFGEAADAIISAKDALVEFGEEALKEAKIAQDIADQRAKADKIERQLQIDRALADRNIAELRFKAEQRQKFTAQERIAFLEEAAKIEDAITAKEIKAAKLRRDALIAENKLSGSTKEDLDAEAEAKARVIELDTQRLNLQKRLQTQITTFTNEAISIRKQEVKALEEIQADATVAELENLQQNEDLKNQIIDTSARQREFNDRVAKQNEIKREELLQKQKIALAGRTFSELASLLGEQTEAGKAAAIAQALINTYQGISNVWAEKAESGLVGAGLAQRLITTAIVAAQGFKAVQGIVSTPNTLGGGGRGSAGASAPSVQQIAPQFNVVGATATNQLAESISNQTNEPVKAYVVSKEVSNQQELDRNIEDTATFG